MLGVAAVLSLFLIADGALVSAGRIEVAPATGVFQSVQASVQLALDGTARFANDMRALYQLSHLDEIAPAEPSVESTAWPEDTQREKLFLCSESQPMKAPAKASI